MVAVVAVVASLQPEVVECLKKWRLEPTEGEGERNKSGAGGNGSAGASTLTSSLQSLKKELLVKARVAQIVVEAQEKESKFLKQWAGNIHSMIQNAAKTGAEAGDEPVAGSAEAPGQQPGLEKTLLAAQMCLSSRHWVAQCAAACVSAFVVGNFGWNRHSQDLSNSKDDLGSHGLLKACNFVNTDKAGDPMKIIDSMPGIVLSKKKIGVHIVGASADEVEKQLEQIRLCFCGRIVAVPLGQPVGFLRTKLKLKSSFFEKLGFSAYVTPIMSPPPVDVACKNPIFVPAWSVRPDKKKPNTVLEAMPLQIDFNYQTIDLELPVLVLGTDAIQRPDSWNQFPRSEGAGGVAVDYVFNLDALLRPLTQDETLEETAKGEVKEAKLQAKKRKQMELQHRFDGFEGPVDDEHAAGGDDEQIDVEASFLKHILR